MKEKKELTINYYGASDIGLVRTENQDSFGKFPKDNINLYQPKGVLFIVADGMGGHAGGKEASRIAVDTVSDEYYSSTSDVITNALLYAFKKANLKIHQSSMDSIQFQKKGTTCSALVLADDQAHIAHVGDSRIYKIDNGNIIQFTNDHTEVGEMFRKGILSEEEAKNHPSKSVLVRAMGIEADVEVDLIENILIKPGDSFVLCSDGLAKVEIEEINRVVLNNTPEEACKKLVSLANESGGKDNVTVLVIKIIGEQSAEVPKYKPTNKKHKPKWLLIAILILLLLSLAVTGFIYQREIWNFFSGNPNKSTDSTQVLDNSTKLDAVESIFIDANNYFSAGNLDSALALYRLILNENPLHIGALNGTEAVEIQYLQKGNQAISQNNNDEALLFFKKAFDLNPSNKILENKIISLQKNLKDTPVEINKNVESKNIEKVKGKSQLLSDSKNNPGGSSTQSYISSIDAMEWNVDGLNEKDYKLNGSGFTFLNTNKSKKIIYKHQMEDIDIEVNLRFDESSVNNKAGIIVGYSKSENTDIEIYYLFTIDVSGNYSLLKMFDGKEEVLIPIKHSAELNKEILKLKVKCLGPWIMLYNDSKLLESYLNKDFIKGKLGLFSQQNTQADFTGLNIKSAFENK